MNDRTELISVVVPVYNAASYVGACIESLLCQSYKNIEIVIVNDGSADNSLDVINEYAKKDKRVLIVDKPNGGVSSARNAGLEKACGKYVIFVDSDDYVEDNFVELLAQHTQENTLTMCGYLNLLCASASVVYSRTEEISRLGMDSFVNLYLRWLINSPCNKIYNSGIIADNAIRFRRGLSLGEDLLFNLEYIKYINDFTVINKPLYHYCHPNEQSLTSSYTTDICTLRNELYKTVLHYCKNDYNIDEDALTGIYDIYIDDMISSFDYILSYKGLSVRARHAIVMDFMGSADFKALLRRLSEAGRIHPLIYFLLNHRMYGTYKFLINIKKRINGAKQKHNA